MRNTTYTYNNKQYKLSNHLGNVLVTTSDLRKGTDINADGIADYYNAIVTTANDYYAFGSLMPARQFNSTVYKYGFNGKEKDNEVKGVGNQIAYELRIYDARLGRWLSTDPRESEYAWQSTYAYYANSPIAQIDYMGGGNGDDICSNEAEFNDVAKHTIDAYSGPNSIIKTTYSTITNPDGSTSSTGRISVITPNNNFNLNYNSNTGWSYEHETYGHSDPDMNQSSSGTGIPNALSPFELNGSGAVFNSYSQAKIAELEYMAKVRGATGAIVPDYPEAYIMPLPKIGLMAKMAIWAKRSSPTTYSVYYGIKNGIVQYVGITSRELAVRWGEHSALNMSKWVGVEGATGITKVEARAIEQKLIEKYGLSKAGGQLLNKINSMVNPKYKEALLKAEEYILNLNLPAK